MARREPRPQANQDERLEPQRTTCIECEQPDVGHEVLWVIREVLLGEIVREAAQPIYEADRHAKKSGSKQVRGIRPIERSLEGQTDEETQAVRDYYLAVRSALTDDRYPPLCASG